MAYNGPFKAYLTECSKDLDYNSSKVSVTFSIKMAIEPRLSKFSAGKCRAIEIITQDGQSLPAEKDSGRSYWNSSRNGSLTISDWRGVSIDNLPPKVRKLKKFVVEVPCKFILGTTQVKFDNVLDAAGTSKKVDEFSVTIKDIQKTEQGVNIKVIITGKGAELCRDFSKPLLVDAEGNTRREGWSRESRWSGESLETTFMFKGVSADNEKAKSYALQFTLPSDSVTQKYQFAFEDVQIP